MNLKRHLFQSLSILVLTSLLAPAVYAEGDPVLREGTPVRMRICQTVSSASAQEGDHVGFETLDDIKADGKVVIPAGSIAQATVTEAVPKRRMGKGGKLNMNIDSVRMPNGDKLALRGVQSIKGGGHGAVMTTSIVATAIVFWPAAPLFLLMQGKDISILQGHEVTVYTNSDYTLIPTAPTAIENSRVSRPVPLHNADILKLLQAGFSEETVLAKIQSSPAMYELGTDDLWRLKAAGVSENIIRAMLATPEK